MKKVLIFANHFAYVVGFRLEIIQKLGDKFDVYVSTPIDQGDLEKAPPIKATMINTPLDRRGINPITDLKLLFKYLSMIRKIKPDIVLTYTIKPNAYGGIACRLTKTPYIANVTGVGKLAEGGFIGKIISMLYKISMKKINCLFFQNKADMAQIKSILGDAIPARLIPGSGVNIDKFSYEDYPKSNDKIIFNFVGRIFKPKGIDEFLQCAKNIKAKHSNVEFRIFGFFDDDNYKQAVEAAEKQGYVKYMGSVKDIRPYVKECHGLIHPSYSEGMSNVCLEHSAMGRPCIASNIPGCREIVEEGQTGLLFDAQSAEDLTRAVEKFLALSNDEMGEMGAKARDKVSLEFDRNLVTTAYLEEIEKIIRG